MDVVVRKQAVDFHTSQGINNSTPDECCYNFADSGTFTPNYPNETGMELTITSVCLPNMLTFVQEFNSTCFMTSSSGNVFPIVLPQANFKGLAGLATVLQNSLVSALSGAWSVTAVPATNKLSITAPGNLVGTYRLSFTDILINGVINKPYASNCRLLGFKQNDVKAFSAGQVVSSTVPCQASGASLIYIACDLFSLDACTVDVFGSSRRGTVLAKLQLTDAPWTTSTYQDALMTFSLKLPAFNISQVTVYLLNEYMQQPQMPVDWSMSGIVQYYSPSPWIQVNQKLDEISQTLKYIWLSHKHASDDQRAIGREQAKTLKQLASIGVAR